MRGLFGNWTSGEEIKCNLDIFLPVIKVLSLLKAMISKVCTVGHWVKKKLLSIHISPCKIPIPLKYLTGLSFFWPVLLYVFKGIHESVVSLQKNFSIFDQKYMKAVSSEDEFLALLCQKYTLTIIHLILSLNVPTTVLSKQSLSWSYYYLVHVLWKTFRKSILEFQRESLWCNSNPQSCAKLLEATVLQ